MTLHRLKVALATGAVALGLVGCGGEDEEGGNGLVSVASVDGTEVLADSDGRTLYTAAVERGGKILCVDACTGFWEPLVASPDEADTAAADLGAELGVVARPGGERQLALGGLPLYTFTEEGPGQLEGDGFVDEFQGTSFEWEVARADGASGDAPASNGSGDGAGFGY